MWFDGCWFHLPNESLFILKITDKHQSLAEANKIERVASYRFLQALSHQVHLLTAGRMESLDFFSVPDGICLDPIKSGQTRLVRREGSRYRAYHCLPSGEEAPLLPATRRWWVPVPLLVLQLDQGPTCTAAAAQLSFEQAIWFDVCYFVAWARPLACLDKYLRWLVCGARYAIHRLQKLISVRWDIYHRSIRDVKLSLLHASGGVFLQAQMHSQYLWALSYRPFSSSAFHEDKVRVLEVMLAREEPESCALFHDYFETIKRDLKMPPWSTPSEIWSCLADAPAFAKKGTLPKLSRWFSWNQSYEEQVSSWNVLKLALAYHFSSSPDIDPDTAAQKRELDALARLACNANDEEKVSIKKEFSQLKEKLGGGLKLAFHLMSNRLLQLVHIIAMVTRPCWSWYTESVRKLNNCQDHLQRLVELARGWASDLHLQETAGVPTSQVEKLVELFHRPEFEELTDTPAKVFELSGLLLQHRAWSLARASAPPDCYVEILHSSPVGSQAGGVEWRLRSQIHEFHCANHVCSIMLFENVKYDDWRNWCVFWKTQLLRWHQRC